MSIKILKFSSTWCAPCKAMQPIFDKVSKNEEFKDIEFCSYDIENDDDGVELVEKYNNEIKDEKDDESLTETWKAKKYSFEELESDKFNLDKCGYPVKEEIILSPKETMNNFIKQREELEKTLDEKLEKIMELIGEIEE